MFRILIDVTGVPPLEQETLRSRDDRRHAYRWRTSSFFPLPPQKGVVT
jgi:steroid 5-alpha reductase family enzyme